MNDRIRDRLFAACGVGYVVVELAGVALGGKTHNLTVSSSASHVAGAIATPAGAGVWAGAYMEMFSTALFLVFAVWAAARLGGGVLGSLARGAAAAYVGATIVALAIGDAIAYRAGHGLGLQTATALVTVQEAVYVATWFLTAAFLAAAGALALAAARRVLGWGAIGIAAYTLVATAVSFDNAGQLGPLLAMVWVVVASVALARGERGRAPAVAVA